MLIYLSLIHSSMIKCSVQLCVNVSDVGILATLFVGMLLQLWQC